MFKKGKKVVAKENEEKLTPAYLREDYPYKAIGEEITDMSMIQDGLVYEINCPICKMCIRSQGQNIREIYQRLINDSGCFGCGNKDLVVKLVDMASIKNNN